MPLAENAGHVPRPGEFPVVAVVLVALRTEIGPPETGRNMGGSRAEGGEADKPPRVAG